MLWGKWYKILYNHSYREHDLTNRNCKGNNCECNGFGSKFTCYYSEGYNTHKAMILIKELRINLWKPFDVGWFGESTSGMKYFGSMIMLWNE